MLHLHAVVRAGWLDQGELSQLAVRAGFGRVCWIGAGSAAAGYAAKAADYCGKALGGWAETLLLNDGRGWHWSRGYCEGEPVREFVRRWTPSRDPGPWRWVPAAEVADLEADRAAWAAALEAEAETILPAVRVRRQAAELDATVVSAALDALTPLGARIVSDVAPAEKRAARETPGSSAFDGYRQAETRRQRALWWGSRSEPPPQS